VNHIYFGYSDTSIRGGVAVKITVEHVPCDENEIILRCGQLDSEMLEILAYLKETMMKIVAQKDNEIVMLIPNEIYYAEAVDNKTFIYTKDSVLESNESLSHLETKYSSVGFIRIGKSQLINLNHVKKLKSIINSRIEITLESGDRLVVSRHYVRAFKSCLGMDS
jgi:DNA-binding LytR/AlgR family response regulator